MNEKTTLNTQPLNFESDKLQRFIFDNAAVRGEWVHLNQSWTSVLTRREYPKAIESILGQMMGAVALLAATVKISGRVVIQIKSEGPVNLAMVECTSDNTVRAFAQYQGDIDDAATLSELMTNGTMAISIEVDGAKQPYQGLVSLQDDSIAKTLELYFEQSEQLQTKIWLSANTQYIAGLFIQQLPSDQNNKEAEEEHWSRISQLASTVTEQELFTLDSETLLHRLFNEEKCRVFEPTTIEFSCNCSRERVAETINLLGEADAQQLLEEQGSVEVACEFCNEHYHFDSVDISQIFADSLATQPESDTIH